MTQHLANTSTQPDVPSSAPADAPFTAAAAPMGILPHRDPQDTAPNLPDLPDAEGGPVVLLCGIGPVAHAVAQLAAQAHFAVDIVDIDPELVAEEHFPMARQRFVLPDFSDLAPHCGIGLQHYIAILTAHPRHSEALLHQALHTQARYIGLSGSREQRAPLFSHLREQGMPTTELACVRCPIGLPIGAQSSQEKAIAIVAELIAAREGCLPRAPKAD